MNKKMMMAGVVVVVVIVAVFLIMKKSGSDGATDDNISEKTLTDIPEMKKEEAPKKLGLADFLTTTGATVCSVTASEGTYHMKADGKRVRVETTASTGSDVPMTVMINDGHFMYTWSVVAGEKQGIKIDLESETFKKATAPTATGANDTYKEADWQNWAKSLEATGASYTCDATTVSDADFLPPTDVKFMDMEVLTKQMESLKKSMPANSDAVPDLGGQQIPGTPVGQ